MTNAGLINPSERYAKLCKDKSGIPISRLGEDDFTYVCLIKYSEGKESNDSNGVNPSNSYCFHNDGDILCIDNELSNIETCGKEESKYIGPLSCYLSIYNLASTANKTSRLSLNRPLVSYPDNVKYAVSPREDQGDCVKKGGIVVYDKSIFQYMCMIPIESFKSIENTHCATLNGKRYCVDEDLTHFNFCGNKEDGTFNEGLCKTALNRFGLYKNITVEDIE
ncbi:hypothetical protein BCR32DRAFT_239479 [Anaeromyces robustus]|uniref:Uncharacterized protein n=1 Tax=Anaeromyces robustus TaxID=1754192 RepID=A0A1Y1XR31_9FUNG|nr:hypothetical protein BCR32DRAFT_239479 [Anaeromyces robustus]|eukprot:ORX88200.1 hypothetical protein BCR32DRAFT_239479 [Anaeromyces robustus]